MSLIRDRVHRLVDLMSDEELASVWAVLSDLYCDLYLLQAVQEAKQSLRPGDTFTREEALRFLSLL